MSKISIREMFEAGVHFGHRNQFWNPKMSPYIFGVRDKVHIINLDKTLSLYQEAVSFASSVASHRGKLLFVGTKSSAGKIVKAEAERCGMPYVDSRWLGGMLTNYKTIRQSLKRLKALEETRKNSQDLHLTKKELLLMDRDIAKLTRSLGGIREMNGLPDALMVIDVGHEKIAVSEARKLKIPVIGVVDTNNDPGGINYVIPGNDDSLKAVKLYLTGIADAIIEAKELLAAEDRKSAEAANAGTSKVEEVKASGHKFNGKVSTAVVRRVASAGVVASSTSEVAPPVATGKVIKLKAKAAATTDDVKNTEEVKVTKRASAKLAPSSVVGTSSKDAVKKVTAKASKTTKVTKATKTSAATKSAATKTKKTTTTKTASKTSKKTATTTKKSSK